MIGSFGIGFQKVADSKQIPGKCFNLSSDLLLDLIHTILLPKK